MGLKYIEMIKSIILILLIILSLTLTFSIWNYTPKYPTIEEPLTVESSVVDVKEIKEIKDIIKPYKLLFNFEDGLKGTSNSDEIDQVINSMNEWIVTDVKLADSEFTEEKLSVLLRKINQFTLFYPGEVPISIYDTVLNMEGIDFPEFTFDRLIVSWNSTNTVMEVHFINRLDGLWYKAKVNDYPTFKRSILPGGWGYAHFTDIQPGSSRFIAVPTNPVDVIQNTYFQKEISPSRFRDALFNDPNAVRRGQFSSSREDFLDDHALMRIETLRKTLSFFHPVAESKERAVPSELLQNTIEFVNEHGGWTDEFRYTNMNTYFRNVKFQLYVQGLPVYSTMTSTEIEQTWGQESIYRYVRPYYTLDLTLPSETKVTSLPSGIEVVKRLMNSDLIDFNTVEEIEMGYDMKHDTEQQLFILEPAWYYLINGNWNRFSPENLGGEMNGLE